MPFVAFLPSALFTPVVSLISNIWKFQDLSQIYSFLLAGVFITGFIAFPSLYIFYAQANNGLYFSLRVFRIWRLGRFKVQFLTSKVFLDVTPCRLWKSYRRFLEGSAVVCWYNSPRTGSPLWLLDWFVFLRIDGNHLRIETAYIPEGLVTAGVTSNTAVHKILNTCWFELRHVRSVDKTVYRKTGIKELFEKGLCT